MNGTLRWVQRTLFTVGLLALAYCGYVATESWMFQRRAKVDLARLMEQSRDKKAATAAAAQVYKAPAVATGGLIGQIDVPRLGVSVAVVEGADTPQLEHAAGHVPGTAMPGEKGNMGIAAHRDTFFRPLRNIRADDVIKVTTSNGEYQYRVVSIKIVKPSDVEVLDSDGTEVLTLVTCYPFYYVGSAPDRFIIRAARTDERTVADLQPTAGTAHP